MDNTPAPATPHTDPNPTGQIMKLKVTARIVAAIAQFRADNDLRHYLNGVCIEPDPAGGVFIIATNGHAMAVWRDSFGVAERTSVLRITKLLEKACKKASSTTSLQISDGRLVVIDDVGNESFSQKRESNKPDDWELPGIFPKWRQLFPNECPSFAIHNIVSSAYVAMAHKALRIGSGGLANFVSICQSAKDKPILLTSDRAFEFIAVIMPAGGDAAGFPSWLKDMKAKDIADVEIPLPGQQPSDAEPVAA